MKEECVSIADNHCVVREEHHVLFSYLRIVLNCSPTVCGSLLYQHRDSRFSFESLLVGSGGSTEKKDPDPNRVEDHTVSTMLSIARTLSA